jgi:16S rRNA (cytosine1402-N4)-methyltransferase
MVEHRPGSGSQPAKPQHGETQPPEASAPGREGFRHEPVMVHDIVALVEPVPTGLFLDATVGGGGHAEAILAAHPHLEILGLDQDRTAIAAAERRLAPFGSRVRLRRVRFDQLAGVLVEIESTADSELDGLSGFLFDLGVSSPQLDRAERGFSYRNDGPLDMRMDIEGSLTAADVVNTYDRRELTAILRRNADERFASRIAEAIVDARPLRTTTELARAVVAAIPAAARRTGGHPAKRTFQAIRIEVNDELGVLASALEQALDALMVGGRGLVLTYHSGEDRIVKGAFRQRTTIDSTPRLPVEPPQPPYRMIRPVSRQPEAAEIEKNPRAGSARLRAIERIAA